MYIGTFTAHRQRNMVRTPSLLCAGDATVNPTRQRNVHGTLSGIGTDLSEISGGPGRPGRPAI